MFEMFGQLSAQNFIPLELFVSSIIELYWNDITRPWRSVTRTLDKLFVDREKKNKDVSYLKTNLKKYT